jgi:hypothetical protein
MEEEYLSFPIVESLYEQVKKWLLMK